MKKFIQKIIQLRNPSFQFDESLNNMALFQFICEQTWSLLRGLKLIFYFRNPKGMLLDSSVSFFNLGKIRWGKLVKIGTHVRISGLGREGVTIGDHVGIGAFSRIIVSTSLNKIGKSIRIGNNVGIGEYAYLGGAGGLEIGQDTIIGQNFSCHPENHIYDDFDTPIRLQGVTRKGITIGNNCWIGSKVTVLDGVHIGNGCVVAAGAVVTKSFTDNSIIGGVPAKLIKMRNE